MKKSLEFLQECGTYYLATTEGDHPRVRPFGGVFEYEGTLYFTKGIATIASFTAPPETFSLY